TTGIVNSRRRKMKATINLYSSEDREFAIGNCGVDGRGRMGAPFLGLRGVLKGEIELTLSLTEHGECQRVHRFKSNNLAAKTWNVIQIDDRRVQLRLRI